MFNMDDDLEAICRIYSEIAKYPLTEEAFDEIKRRFYSFEVLQAASRSELTNELEIPDIFCDFLEFLRRFVASNLFKCVARLTLDKAHSAIINFANFHFIGLKRQSLLVFYYREGDLIYCDEPGAGTLFSYDVYARDIMSQALKIDSDKILLVFGSPLEIEKIARSKNDFINDLRKCGKYLQIDLLEPIFIRVQSGDMPGMHRESVGMRRAFAQSA